MPVQAQRVDDDRPRVRLGSLVRARRLALDGMTQAEAAAAAGVSDSTWLKVEAGEKVSDRSLAGIERALRWEPGSCNAILAGGEPTEARVTPTSALSLADEVAILRRRLELAERQIENLRQQKNLASD